MSNDLKREEKLTERTVSKPGATLEIKVVEIPQAVKDAIDLNIQRGKVEAKKEHGMK